MKKKISADFQICIRVTLRKFHEEILVDKISFTSMVTYFNVSAKVYPIRIGPDFHKFKK